MRSDPVESARFYLHGLASLFGRRLVAEADLVWVLRRSPPVDYAAGQVVFRQGELAESAILVVHGELVASVSTPDGERVVGAAGAWDVVGETGLYAPDQPRSATVRATRDSTALLITHQLLAEGRSNPVIGAIEYHLLHTITRRIRNTNQALETAWSELESRLGTRPPGEEPTSLVRALTEGTSA